MTHLLIQADARKIPLADRSVHCVVTSPPFFALRDYGTATWQGGDPDCDHKRAVAFKPDLTSTLNCNANANGNHAQEPYRDICGKCGARRIDAQIGLEATPEAFIDEMVKVFREVRRVLHDTGTVWINLGDSYSGSPAGNSPDKPSGFSQSESRRNGGAVYLPKRETSLKPKDLIGIPWRVALALQADGWYLRSDIIWAKPNPMPESVTDRPTKSHEYLFLLAKQERYYFDAEAVRCELSEKTHVTYPSPDKASLEGITRNGKNHSSLRLQPEAGRNIRSVWSIPTEAYPGSHFATFPRKLVEPCVKAGTSEKGCCSQCSAPWERVVEAESRPNWQGNGQKHNGTYYRANIGGGVANDRRGRKLTGWRPTCQCFPANISIEKVREAWPIPCRVLDPFAGSGTTLVVAEALGRSGIGLDLSVDYLAQARRRIERPHQPGVRQREKPMPLFPMEAQP